MKYKIKNTDLFHNGKLIPEGSTIDLSNEDSKDLSDYLEEIQEIKKDKTELKKNSKSENKK
jgi:hypothetical protein